MRRPLLVRAMNAPSPLLPHRPWLRLVLAVSLDGRLAPPEGGAAQIGGRGDRRVLEEALAWADGALLGAETLRRHGSTCLIHASDLLAERRRQGRSDQPLALVASRGGSIPDALPFFRQPLERWLLLAETLSRSNPAAAVSGSGSAWGEARFAAEVVTGPASGSALGREASEPTTAGAEAAAAQGLDRPPADQPAAAAVQTAALVPDGFARVIPLPAWQPALEQLAAAGLQRLVVLGGASLAASLLAENRIDELQLTLCPQLLGGEHAWLGLGAAVPAAARAGWRLLEQRCLEGEELLLRYGRERLEA